MKFNYMLTRGGEHYTLENWPLKWETVELKFGSRVVLNAVDFVSSHLQQRCSRVSCSFLPETKSLAGDSPVPNVIWITV